MITMEDFMYSMKKIFRTTRKDAYHAHRQLPKALPKMARAAHGAPLKRAFTEHREETQQQVARLGRPQRSANVHHKRGRCPPRGPVRDPLAPLTGDARTWLARQSCCA
jgi:ferritin-like metal-binding protein YciE